MLLMTGLGAVERPVELPAKRSRDVVIVSFYSGGQADKEGRGIAVVDGSGAAVAFNVFAHDPAGQTWLAVDVSGKPEGLRLRYGSTSTRDAKRDESIQPSLVLQVFPLSSPNYVSESDLFNAARTSSPLGTVLVDQISHAFNPFGPDVKYISVYRGLLKGKGEFRFFSAHRESGYVELDGKMLTGSLTAVATRESGPLAQGAKAVQLEDRLYRVRYAHAQKETVPPLAMLGMIGKGERAVAVPADRFIHDAMATLGDATDPAAVGLDAMQVDQLVYDGWVFSRWRLKAIAPAIEGKPYRWVFGDGTSVQSDGREVEHVFAAKGDDLGVYSVRLDRANTAGKAECMIRPRRAFDQKSINDVEVMQGYAAAIGSHDLAKVSPEVLLGLYSLLSTTEQPSLIAPVAEAYAARGAKKDDPLAWDMTYSLATHLVKSDPARAEILFRELSAAKQDSWKTACAAAWYLDVMIFNEGKGEQARNLAPRLAASRDVRERSLLMARLGDVLRLKGDADHALEEYQRAQRLIARESSAREAAVVERAHREAALDLLRQQRLPALRDVLFQWEADFPAAKMGGDLPLLTGQYFQAIGDHKRAAAEFESLLTINPLHPSRPEIMYRLALSLMKLEKKAEAEKWLKELMEKYPNSPYAKAGTGG